MKRTHRFSQIDWLGWACWGLLAVCFGSSSVAAEDATKTNSSSQVIEVRKVLDVPYYQGADADPVKHKLDLYLPKNQTDFPVVFFVHGGAWRHGDKSGFLGFYGHLASSWARHGLGVVVTN